MKKTQRRKLLTISIYCLLVVTNNNYADEIQNDPLPYGVAAYYGNYIGSIFRQALLFNYGHIKKSGIGGLSFSYQLPRTSKVGRFFNYIYADPVLIGDLMYSHQQHPVYQINTFFGLRWQRFSWSHYLHTSITIGIGPSWASNIPNDELEQVSSADKARHLLNGLMLELAVSLPQYQQLEIFYRISHRSGVFGLLSPEVIDSGPVGFGVRWRF